jgi:hypothetical protein
MEQDKKEGEISFVLRCFLNLKGKVRRIWAVLVETGVLDQTLEIPYARSSHILLNAK